MLKHKSYNILAILSIPTYLFLRGLGSCIYKVGFKNIVFLIRTYLLLVYINLRKTI